jgi:photosystem II stability/assembly factor-like uncharacterized protein
MTNRRAVWLAVTALAGIAGTAHAATPPALTPVSGPDPFTGCAAAGLDQEPLGSENPVVAINPLNPANIVAAWQQHHGRGIVAGVSEDGGRTWQQVVVRGLTRCTHGKFDDSDNPWLTFTADGSLELSAHVFDAGGLSGMLVLRSHDGGLTWSRPRELPDPEGHPYASGTMAADPSDPDLIYSVILAPAQPQGTSIVFTRSADGGKHWSAPATILGTGPGSGAQILVLPDRDLAVVVTSMPAPGRDARTIAVIRSADEGETWSTPVRVAAVKAGPGLASAAVDPATGGMYVTWPDSRWDFGKVNAIAMASSADDGQTWTRPVRISQDQFLQAFTPSVTVTAEGTIAVSYYQYRTPRIAARYLATCRPLRTLTCRVSELAAPFNVRQAPQGRYAGMASDGMEVAAAFTQPDATSPADVFVSVSGR